MDDRYLLSGYSYLSASRIAEKYDDRILVVERIGIFFIIQATFSANDM